MTSSMIESHAARRLRQALAELEVRRSQADLPTDPGRMFGEAYLVNLASDLGLPHVTVILRAEGIRERGLALVRSAQLEEASQTLHQAEETCRRAGLSRHGIHAARTFQAAAEAFLAFRLGNYDEAVGLLNESIESCRVLSDEYAHNMEFRKVHLCRNVIRTQCFTTPVSKIMESTIRLLHYTQGDPKQWPFLDHQAWSTWRPLTRAESLWTIDEAVANLSLPALDLKKRDISEYWDADRDENSPERWEPGVSTAIREWLLAIASTREDRIKDSYCHAWAFLERAPIEFVQLRKAIEYVVLQPERVRSQRSSSTLRPALRVQEHT